MDTLKQIETAILQLSAEDLRRLSSWLHALEQQRWDEQLERDAAAGKLDSLANQALVDFQAGRYRPV